MGQRAADDVEHHVHLPADQVVERRACSPVGDVAHLHACHGVEQLPCQMLRCAVAGRRKAQHRLARLGQRQEFGQGLDAERGVHFQHQRKGRELDHRCQIGQRVERHAGVERGVHRHRATGRQQQRVAVSGSLLRDFCAARVATGAALVVHHHRHAQAALQLGLQHAGHQVGGAAGRVGHHKADGLAGEGGSGRLCGSLARQAQGQGDGQGCV